MRRGLKGAVPPFTGKFVLHGLGGETDEFLKAAGKFRRVINFFGNDKRSKDARLIHEQFSVSIENGPAKRGQPGGGCGCSPT